MEQNDRLEKNKDFFQGKQLFNTKLLRIIFVMELPALPGAKNALVA